MIFFFDELHSVLFVSAESWEVFVELFMNGKEYYSEHHLSRGYHIMFAPFLEIDYHALTL